MPSLLNPLSFFRVLCGSRIRVELSTGMSRKSRYGRPSRRHFDPNDRCYQCGESGHYAYDCSRFSKRGGGRRRSRYSVEAAYSRMFLSPLIGMSLLLNDIQRHGGSKRMYFLWRHHTYLSLNATPFYCTYLSNDPLPGPAHGQDPGEGVTAHAAEATAATGEWLCHKRTPAS